MVYSLSLGYGADSDRCTIVYIYDDVRTHITHHDFYPLSLVDAHPLSLIDAHTLLTAISIDKAITSVGVCVVDLSTTSLSLHSSSSTSTSHRGGLPRHYGRRHDAYGLLSIRRQWVISG